MTQFHPMREIPQAANFQAGDILVVFGELFSRGYANGIVDEARKHGMKVIFSTVGRRDEGEHLRPLHSEELSQCDPNLINVPLEAGFDMTPCEDGTRPVDQLKGLGLKDWESARLDWSKLKQSQDSSIRNFRSRVSEYLRLLDQQIPAGKNVVFVHTMAGGVPRAKVLMPAMNRVFKGSGDRYASSEHFWNTDLGRFCEQNFYEVTAHTFQHLIELSENLRKRIIKSGGRVSYVAYGYHGTEVLCGSEYRWQSYSPYLQGFAKIRLEEIAEASFRQDIKAMVFNAPEILTNSSSIFLGVEVMLYALLGALRREGAGKVHIEKIIQTCLKKLKPEYSVERIMREAEEYLMSPVMQKWSQFSAWPQHNGPEQMALMKANSDRMIDAHLSEKDLATAELSEVVFRACGDLMLRHAWQPEAPVWWIGHDIVAKQSKLAE